MILLEEKLWELKDSTWAELNTYNLPEQPSIDSVWSMYLSLKRTALDLQSREQYYTARVIWDYLERISWRTSAEFATRILILYKAVCSTNS